MIQVKFMRRMLLTALSYAFVPNWLRVHNQNKEIFELRQRPEAWGH
jgi:hypothetical protein